MRRLRTLRQALIEDEAKLDESEEISGADTGEPANPVNPVNPVNPADPADPVDPVEVADGQPNATMAADPGPGSALAAASIPSEQSIVDEGDNSSTATTRIVSAAANSAKTMDRSGRGRSLKKSSEASGQKSATQAGPMPGAKPGLSGHRGPDISDDIENDWTRRIHEQLLNVLDLSRVVSMPEDKARAQIREAATRLLDGSGAALTAQSRQRVVKGIENEILGHGPLEPLLEDPSIADILVNRFDSVYVERRGKLEKTRVRFRDNQHLLTIIDRIVSNVGRRVDESSPMVDARLADGSRVNAIVPPLALDGPAMSIRRFIKDKLSTDDLIRTGSMTDAMAEVLSAIVKARLNIIVSGGTGTGKTTILNILSGFIGADERVITIEDSAELQLQQPHVIRLETRPQNIEGRGEITQRDLVRNSLRMRPDRVIIGEVRGGEALDMLQAMNTGHDGSLATLHANTPRDALSRMENMVSMAGLKLPITTVRSQIASAVDVILQLERMEDGKRRVTSLQEIQGMEGDIITMSEIFTFQRQGVDDAGNVLGQFTATGLVPKFHDTLKKRGKHLNTEMFRPSNSASGTPS